MPRRDAEPRARTAGETAGVRLRRLPPGAVVGVAAAMFAAVLGVRWLTDGPADAVALLFTIPVALLAVTLGARAGALGSLVGIALLALWVRHAGGHLTVLGWVARATPMLLLGVLLGRAVDLLHRTDAERHRLATRADRHRAAVELNDTMVQALTAAKWSLESGNTLRALDIVSDTLEVGHRLVSDLIRDAELGSAWTGPTVPGRPPET